MNENATESIRESYDRVAEEYARRLFNELAQKSLDRELLNRFAAATIGRGEVCDMGCGPGQVARYLRDAGTTVFGLDLSPRMLEQARRLNPEISFREGNMMALDLPDGSLAGIAAFYAIVNIPKESHTTVFREMERILQPDGLLLVAFHTGATKLFTRMNCGTCRFRWTFSSFSHPRCAILWRRLVLPLKRSSNATLMVPKLSTRAEEHTSSHESQTGWRRR
jgi:ubiquinone/menaquinone biosynthesis C-methylase UbiE